MTVSIAEIYRYPVKGLNGQRVEGVLLEPDRPLPWDRRFAIAQGSVKSAGGSVAWQPKMHFVTLMRQEKLAQLDARFDETTGQLEILRNDRRVAGGRIIEALGRTLVDQFLAAFLDDVVTGQPRVVMIGEGGAFADCPEPYLSMVNLASIGDLERVIGRPVEPQRFRGNILIDGLPAWEERKWIGRTIRLGELGAEVVAPIDRCAATNVNPETAERDANVPQTLLRGYGHTEMGVYLRIRQGGRLTTGDMIDPGAP